MFAQQWDYIVYLSIRNCVLIFLLPHIYYPNSYPVCLQEIHAFYEIEINDSCWQVLISFLQHNRVHLNHSWHCQASRSSPSTGYIYQLQWSHLSVKQSLCQAYRYWWNLRFESKVGQCYGLACLLYVNPHKWKFLSPVSHALGYWHKTLHVACYFYNKIKRHKRLWAIKWSFCIFYIVKGILWLNILSWSFKPLICSSAAIQVL